MCRSFVLSGVSGCGPSKKPGFGGHCGMQVVTIARRVEGSHILGQVDIGLDIFRDVLYVCMYVRGDGGGG